MLLDFKLHYKATLIKTVLLALRTDIQINGLE